MAALINPHVDEGSEDEQEHAPLGVAQARNARRARPDLHASGRTARTPANINKRKFRRFGNDASADIDRIRKGWIRYCRSIEPTKINAAEAMRPARTRPKVHANACTSVLSRS